MVKRSWGGSWRGWAALMGPRAEPAPLLASPGSSQKLGSLTQNWSRLSLPPGAQAPPHATGFSQ